MRKSKLTADEIIAAEQAADDRKTSRSQGFDMMRVRDKGWTRLKNGMIMAWHVDPKVQVRYLYPGQALKTIPPGKFMLLIDNKEHYFEAEDFQKYLRWT